jgi:hypothetical protein
MNTKNQMVPKELWAIQKNRKYWAGMDHSKDGWTTILPCARIFHSQEAAKKELEKIGKAASKVSVVKINS